MPESQFIGLEYSAEHLQAFLDFLKYWRLDEVFFTLDKCEQIDISFLPKKSPARPEFIKNHMDEPKFLLPDGTAYVCIDAIGVRAILDGSEEIAITSMTGYLYRSGSPDESEPVRRYKLCRKRRKRFLKIW